MNDRHPRNDRAANGTETGARIGDGARPRRAGLLTRRQVLAGAGGLAAAAAFGAAGCSGESAGSEETSSTQEDTGGTGETTTRDVPAPAGGGSERRDRAYQIRVDAAQYQRDLPDAEHPNNGDEERYENRIASFAKTLPHDDNGEVEPEAYDAFLEALASDGPFDSVPQGGSGQLDSPEAALAFVMEGPDSHNTTMIPAPAFDSAQMAGEVVEAYWQALLRDVSFADYAEDDLVGEALSDLSGLEDFRGPKSGGQVTPETLFRSGFSGETTGPYLSQFVWRTVPFGALSIEQQYRVPVAGDDFMTSYEEWLSIQNGDAPSAEATFDSTRRYLRNGRDLSYLVHGLAPAQLGVAAALILMSYEDRALIPDGPYYGNENRPGFATFGDPHVVDLVVRLYNDSLKAAWFQKFYVHRRLRPEEFGGRVHNLIDSDADYPIHGDLPDSPALERVYSQNGNYLLPQSFPEGCPNHPSYPQGHSTSYGAMITILKAIFDEEFVLPDSAVPNSDGTALETYDGPDLTVGGELNKLASNVAFGRNIAGVHFRSDGIEGLKLGEAVATGVLRDMKDTYVTGDFNGFFFTSFDGEQVEI